MEHDIVSGEVMDASIDEAAALHAKGLAFETGSDGKTIDHEQAFSFYMKAAELGHQEAQTSVGDLYQLGRGVKKQPEEAVKWWRKAADAGHAKAQFNVAVACYNKQTVRSVEEAVDYFHMAADQDYGPAQHHLSHLYIEGKFVSKDPDAGFEYAYKAAMNGIAASQVDLALMYATGNGAEKDVVEAFAWAMVATDTMDSHKTRQVRDYLRDGMNLDHRQMSEGRIRSRRHIQKVKTYLEEKEKAALEQ